MILNAFFSYKKLLNAKNNNQINIKHATPKMINIERNTVYAIFQ